MQWKDDIQNIRNNKSGLKWKDDLQDTNTESMSNEELFNSLLKDKNLDVDTVNAATQLQLLESARKRRRIVNGIDPALSKIETEKTALEKAKEVPGKALRIFNIASDAAQKDATLGLAGEGGPIDKLAAQIVSRITGKDTSDIDIIPEPETKAERFAQGAGGFIGATVPVATVSKLGALLPKVPGKGLTSKAINNAISGGTAGAVYEGAKSLIEGDSPSEAANKAGVGALTWGGIEAALPVAGAGIKKGLDKLLPKKAESSINLDPELFETPVSSVSAEKSSPIDLLTGMQDEYQGMNIPRTQADKALPDNLLLNQMRNTYEGKSNTPIIPLTQELPIRRDVDMNSLPDNYPLPDLSNLEGKALAARARAETPALPEPSVNWEKGTGYPNGKTTFVDPHGVARTTPGTPAELGPGLPETPSINLQGKKGNITWPSMETIEKAQAEAIQRIRERNTIYTSGKVNFTPRNPADDIKDLTIIGAAKMTKTGVNYEDWLKAMVKEVGSQYEPVLKNLWEPSQTLVQKGSATVRYAGQDIVVNAESKTAGNITGQTINNNSVAPEEIVQNERGATTSGTRTRGLSESASKLKWIDEGVKTGLEQEAKEGGRGTYDPITNADTLEQAKQLLEQDTDAVTRRILSNEPASATDNAAGMLLVKQAQDAGDYSKAVDFIESMAKKATEQGQAIQALSMWGRLTPEGMLQYGQKVIERANRMNKKAGGKANRYKMTPETAEKVTTYMKQAEGLEGRARDIKVAQALDEIAGQVPASILRKISTLQTMAQLLNPKTAIRNIVGNLGFQGLENASDVVGTGLDKGISLITGNRTKVLPSLTTQAKGMVKGTKQGLEDAVLGIDTSNMAGGKFDLPTTRTFRKGPLSWAEKAMNIELRASDRAFYQAANDESLRQQMAAASKSGKAVSEPTEAMQEIAHYDALYRTFQDSNALSNAFTGIKRALNGGKEFGIGDFVLKYPKTPANLLARGLEYSPAGFTKTVMELGKPLFGKEFNQKAFVESASRATTGTASLVGTGVLMHRLGLITGGPDEDKDVAALEQQAGFGQYRLNVSGLKRFISSGFNPEAAKLQKNDITVSYDWFQPSSIDLAIGADIDANKGQAKGIAGTLVNAFTTGINAFADQPVVQGLQTLFGQREPADAIPAILEGVPASFVPTLLNQIKQLVDNQKRNTYDPNFKNEMLNRAKTRIPGMAEDLPQAYGTLGQKRTTYQEGDRLTTNKAFNVFFNPAFVNKYAPTKEAQMVIDLYKNTGETSQVPRVIAKYFNVSGQKITLTPEEYSAMQKQVGELTREGFSKIPANLSDEDKLKAMGTVMTDAGQEAKITVLEKRGIPLPNNWMTGPGYVIRAISKGDMAKAKSYTAKNSASNAYAVYEYGQKHGMVDEQGNPDEQLTKALSEVWSAQTEGQSKTAALNFLLNACENGNEEQAANWAQIVNQTGLTKGEIMSRIKQKAKLSETGAKTPTIDEIMQGGYDISPDTLQRLWWVMGY